MWGCLGGGAASCITGHHSTRTSAAEGEKSRGSTSAPCPDPPPRRGPSCCPWALCTVGKTRKVGLGMLGGPAGGQSTKQGPWALCTQTPAGSLLPRSWLPHPQPCRDLCSPRNLTVRLLTSQESHSYRVHWTNLVPYDICDAKGGLHLRATGHREILMAVLSVH